jgi:hypothetical protein
MFPVFKNFGMKKIVIMSILFVTLALPALTAPVIEECQIFPSDNIWNVPVDTLPVDSRSDEYLDTIGRTTGLHPDFGSGLWEGGPIGFPYNVVNNGQARVSVAFDYADESDPGPYPIPADPLREWGSDHHILIVDRDNAVLYELYAAEKQQDGSWRAGSGAIFDLRSNALRPDTWTSADAAGLPILPGLVRYEEVSAGEIQHALRFTAPETRRAYVWPARHYASDLTETRYPPMGQRFRLKADFDITSFSSEVQVILRAFKKYGIILADNGASWYISGVPDERWDNDALHALDLVTGNDFEAVDVSSLMVDPDSGQARQAVTLHPEIRANGSTGTVVIAGSQSLTITVTLPDGSSSGANADWWLIAITPSGIYYYVYPGLWVTAAGLDLVQPAFQGALFNLPSTEAFNISGLMPGTYQFYFGVDRLMNGILDYDYLDYAVVEVRVE